MYSAPRYFSHETAEVVLSECRQLEFSPTALFATNALLDELLGLFVDAAMAQDDLTPQIVESLSLARFRLGVKKIVGSHLGKIISLEAELAVNAFDEEGLSLDNIAEEVEVEEKEVSVAAPDLFRSLRDEIMALSPEHCAPPRSTSQLDASMILYAERCIHSLGIYFLQCFERQSSSGKDIVGLAEVSTGLKEDRVVWDFVRSTRVWGYIERQLADEEATLGSISTNLSAFARPLSFSTLARTGDRPHSLLSTTLQDSMRRSTSTRSDLSSTIEPRKSLSTSDREEFTRKFEQSMRNGQTMKVTLTPSRIKTEKLNGPLNKISSSVPNLSWIATRSSSTVAVIDPPLPAAHSPSLYPASNMSSDSVDTELATPEGGGIAAPSFGIYEEPPFVEADQVTISEEVGNKRFSFYRKSTASPAPTSISTTTLKGGRDYDHDSEGERSPKDTQSRNGRFKDFISKINPKRMSVGGVWYDDRRASMTSGFSDDGRASLASERWDDVRRDSWATSTTDATPASPMLPQLMLHPRFNDSEDSLFAMASPSIIQMRSSRRSSYAPSISPTTTSKDFPHPPSMIDRGVFSQLDVSPTLHQRSASLASIGQLLLSQDQLAEARRTSLPLAPSFSLTVPPSTSLLPSPELSRRSAPFSRLPSSRKRGPLPPMPPRRISLSSNALRSGITPAMAVVDEMSVLKVKKTRVFDTSLRPLEALKALMSQVATQEECMELVEDLIKLSNGGRVEEDADLSHEDSIVDMADTLPHVDMADTLSQFSSLSLDEPSELLIEGTDAFLRGPVSDTSTPNLSRSGSVASSHDISPASSIYTATPPPSPSLAIHYNPFVASGIDHSQSTPFLVESVDTPLMTGSDARRDARRGEVLLKSDFATDRPLDLVRRNSAPIQFDHLTLKSSIAIPILV